MVRRENRANRRFQFRLRTLLILMTVVAAVMALLSDHVTVLTVVAFAIPPVLAVVGFVYLVAEMITFFRRPK
jgi:hypothetical protein